MAIIVVKEPLATVPAYEKNALAYEWKEAYAISNKTNNGGFLELTVGSTAVGLIEVGDYVYVSSLVGVDFADSPVKKVISTTATEITLDFVHQSLAVGGEIRLMRKQVFVIQSGVNVNQPFENTLTAQLIPEPDGIYRLSAFRAAVSRFNFDQGIVEAAIDVAHFTQIRAYEIQESPPSYITALKQNQNTTPALPIVFSNQRSIISKATATNYATFFESSLTPTLPLGVATDYYYYHDKVVVIDFESSIADADTTSSPSPLPSWATYNTLNSGQTLTGITLDLRGLDPAETDSYAFEIIEDNGIDPPKNYQFDVNIFSYLTSRVECEDKSTRVYWWHPEGGWVSYSFELQKVHGVENEGTVLSQSEEGRIVTSYENQFQTISLLAKPEAEYILDYLNSMFLSTEIYIIKNKNLEGDNIFERYFAQGFSGTTKKTKPYQPYKNRFSVTLTRSQENRAINQD